MLNCHLKTLKIYLLFLSHFSMRQYFKSFLMEGKDWFFLHGQYDGFWCHGDTRRPGISTHDINCEFSWTIPCPALEGSCIWPSDARSQGIERHGIYLLHPDHAVFSIKKPIAVPLVVFHSPVKVWISLFHLSVVCCWYRNAFGGWISVTYDFVLTH